MNKEEKNTASSRRSYEPLVSIIIPIYNGEKFILETIDSVKKQTYSNWELLIIDNCSNDNTFELISLHQSSKIRVFKTELNSGGPAVPRNIGIKKANGEYIAFLDADDIWENNKLEVQIGFIQQNDFICSLASSINEKGKVIKKVKFDNNKFYKFSNLVNVNKIINSSVIVSREKFLSIMFDEDTLLNGLEDYHSYLTYTLLHGPILLIGKPLIKRRIMVFSLGERIFGEQRLAKSIYCLTKVMLLHGKYNYYLIGLLRRLLSYFKNRFIK